MPTIQLPFEAILEATETLTVAQRDTLARHLELVEQKREHFWTRRVDAILVGQINDSAPLPGDVERLHELRALTNDGTISDQERAEFLRIVARIESLGVQRLKLAIELAKLRDVPPAQLVDEMGLFPTR